jgi:hypothetical protein
MPCGWAGCGSHTGCDHPDAAVLLFARMLIGLAIGADSAIATACRLGAKNRRGPTHGHT